MRVMTTLSLISVLACSTSACSGGDDGDGGPNLDAAVIDAMAGQDAPASACTNLDQAACDAAQECQSALGAPAEEICIDDYSNWGTVWSGCIDASVGCDDVETCASDPNTGTRLYFPDSCVPDGWSACDCQVPASCQQGGDLVGLGRLCVRGTQGVTGESIDADTHIRIEASPYGCFGSGCVFTYDNACAATVAGDTITVDSLFCIGPSDAEVCKPDCSGAGDAICHTDTLAAGDYTVQANGRSVSFTVPSVLPFGGVCDELPL